MLRRIYDPDRELGNEVSLRRRLLRAVAGDPIIVGVACDAKMNHTTRSELDDEEE